MPAHPAAAAFALALLVLAGCAGKDAATSAPAPAPTPAAGHAAPTHAPQGLMPPTLKVGDWWNFTAPGGALSYVVSADAGNDYTMDTDNAGLAFFDALSDVSTLGAIRKSDLAGSQGSNRVVFLQWPLTDGKNWTTTWDGIPVAISAKVSGDTAQMTAKRQNGTLYATYTYSNRTRWFTDLDFMDEKGSSAFELKLQASGANFAGTLLRWKILGTSTAHNNGPAVGDNFQFQVPAEATDVLIGYATACNPGAFVLSTGPFGPAAQASGAINQGPCDGPHQVDLPAAAGQWGFALTCSGNPCDVQHQLYVRQRITFAPGKAP